MYYAVKNMKLNYLNEILILYLLKLGLRIFSMVEPINMFFRVVEYLKSLCQSHYYCYCR